MKTEITTQKHAHGTNLKVWQNDDLVETAAFTKREESQIPKYIEELTDKYIQDGDDEVNVTEL